MNEKLLAIPTRQKHVGKHLILDAWRISSDRLNDPEFLRRSLKQAVEDCGATLINLCVHQFSPYGVTATATAAIMQARRNDERGERCMVAGV